MPGDLRGRLEVLQWLFWQVGGLGPMAGQLSHFVNYAPGEHPYSRRRYAEEYDRLFAVMDDRLASREFLAGEYSIADMASWPWVSGYKRLGEDLDDFDNLKRWHETMKARPAVQKGRDAGADLRMDPKTVGEAAKKMLFGQDAKAIRERKQAAAKPG